LPGHKLLGEFSGYSGGVFGFVQRLTKEFCPDMIVFALGVLGSLLSYQQRPFVVYWTSCPSFLASNSDLPGQPQAIHFSIDLESHLTAPFIFSGFGIFCIALSRNIWRLDNSKILPTDSALNKFAIIQILSHLPLALLKRAIPVFALF